MAAIDLKGLLGEAIRSQRSTLRISQEELASRAGLHRTYVSDVERGARNPSIKSIEKLAGALQTSVSKLFERDSDGKSVLVQILLVEDNPRDVELTLHAFKRANITNPVHILRDGEEGLEFIFGTGRYAHRAEVQAPQVVLLDLNLPKKSGIEVLERIKSDKRTRKIPVVILTASNRDRDIVACRRLGAEDYIVKPVRFQNFSEVVAHLSLAWTLVTYIPGAGANG
jgi:CheY-like chemotaxis protein